MAKVGVADNVASAVRKHRSVNSTAQPTFLFYSGYWAKPINGVAHSESGAPLRKPRGLCFC